MKEIIDPIVGLVFAIYSSPGAYALLLGSGVSRSAKIPTGWEIVLDLVTKYAKLSNEEIKGDPASWYQEKFGEEPEYSKLLKNLAKTSTERNRLLRSYFEPTEEEREEGDKAPTQAHKAIAELVRDGFVKIIITTNFDKLVELALQDVGITPVVISTPDSAEGALPVAHSKCTIIKVHGDYLDTRIKNTPDELASYDPRVDDLLDRIFDEYGLIVCGWSAEWDIALRDAISRCKSRRFTFWWTHRGSLGRAAKELIALKQAEVIQIQDADRFFEELGQKIAALKETAKVRHPLSTNLAIATVKRYLSKPSPRISLHDFVNQETETLYDQLTIEHFPAQDPHPSNPDIAARVRKYESIVSVVQSILMTGCFWGDEGDVSLWVNTIDRVANPKDYNSGYPVWMKMSRYPALLLLYAGGLAAIANNNLNTVSALFAGPKVDKGPNEKAAIILVNAWSVMETKDGQCLPGMKGRYAPVSDHLHRVLREPLQPFIADAEKYTSIFDRFEYLLGLAYADLSEETGEERRGPVGSYGWRYRDRDFKSTIMGQIKTEVEGVGDSWPFISHGLFNGSIERFWEVKTAFDKFVMRVRDRWAW